MDVALSRNGAWAMNSRLGASMKGDSFLIARSLGVPIRSRSSFSEVTGRLNMNASAVAVVQPK